VKPAAAARARDQAEIDRVIRENEGQTPARVADLIRRTVTWFWSGNELAGRESVSRRARELGIRLADTVGA
jgi:hypothetical protein